MPVFSKLFQDTLGVIGGFLSAEEFHYLCLTSKEIYEEIKLFKYLKLNKKYSLLFYENEEFRNKVISSIEDKSKQLSLDLRWCDKVSDVSALAGVHTLNLRHCDNVTDVSALGGVHTLDLSYCNNVTDVSALGRRPYFGFDWLSQCFRCECSWWRPYFEFEWLLSKCY